MQPEKLEEIKGWLAKAEDDLRSCEADLAFDPPIRSDALFHCQQAVEKSLKAFLTAHDSAFSKTHDIDKLAQDCELLDATLLPTLELCRRFTVYAWMSRYPNSWDDDLPDEPSEALSVARRAFHAIMERVPESARIAECHPASILLPPHGVALDEVERTLIRQALKRSAGNIDEASSLLGVTREALQSRMRNYGIDGSAEQE